MTLTADELLVIHKAIGRCEEYDACDYCLYEKACNELVEKVNEQQRGPLSGQGCYTWALKDNERRG